MSISDKYLTYLLFIFLMFSSEVSIGQSKAFASNKMVNCIPACARYNANIAFYDIVKFSFAPDMSKGAIMLDELEVNPILAAGISVTKFTSSVSIVDPLSGQLEEVIGEIIESNSPYVDVNGIIELEIEIRGVYSYDPTLYNGVSNPLVFACNVYGYTYNLKTEDFTDAVLWNAQYDPETEVICNEEGIHKSFTQISGNFGEKVYPNPSKGVFNVQIEGRQLSPVEVALFSFSGQRIVISKENMIQNSDQGLKLNLGSYADGIYFLRIPTENGEQVLKLVKEN